MASKGVYCLCIEVMRDLVIEVGALGRFVFPPSYYIYVGSAMNGLEPRVRRHLKTSLGSITAVHWHIDYLLKEAKIIDVFYKESIQKEECIIAKILSEKLRYINDFGCSDCKCRSHLFYGELNYIDYIIEIIEMKKYSTNANI